MKKTKVTIHYPDLSKIKEELVAVLMIYLGISFVGLILGLGSMDFVCNKPSTRIGYVFPAYKLGCWLGSVPSEE